MPTLVREMGDAYPELKRAESLIIEIIKLEEERFGETLDRGLKLLEEECKSFKSGDSLDGDVAFKLFHLLYGLVVIDRVVFKGN